MPLRPARLATAHTFTGISNSRLPLLITGSDEQKQRDMPGTLSGRGYSCGIRPRSSQPSISWRWIFPVVLRGRSSTRTKYTLLGCL